jgi:MFS family permease
MPTSPWSLTFRQWLVLAIASIGFLFDTYELLMTPLVGVPAIAELTNLPPNHPDVTGWMGTMLWLTALCGGIFGLLGGWLIDRFGRKRIMALSIFVYALSPFAAAFSTTLPAFIFFRCTTFIGVCVEFVAAITWLAELFPEKRQREVFLGSTQAFASLGGILITAVSAYIVKNAGSFPALHLPELFDAHATWRYTLMTGLLPAIPIAIMLPFVPESQVWRERRDAGTLKRPSFGELFSPALRRVTLVTAALSACAYGAAFGALQVTPRSVAPGTPELREQQEALGPLGRDAKALNDQLTALNPRFNQALQEVPGLRELAARRSQNRKAFRAASKTDPAKAAALAAEFKDLNAQLGKLTASNPDAKNTLAAREKILKDLGDNREKQAPFDTAVKERGNNVQWYQETGGLVGRIILALLIVAAIPRRSLLRIFLIPGLAVLPLTYFSLYHVGGAAFDWGIFACGLLIVAQFSYFGEYLPRVFPLHLRGTGGSFATNVGGRMIGTSAAILTTQILAPKMNAISTFDRVAMAAGIVGLTVFAVGFLLSFLLPEPKHEDLPEGAEGAKAAVQNPGVTPAA